MRRMGLAVLLLGLSAGSGAHELWMEKASDELVLRYGHGPDSEEGPKRLAYTPEQVNGIWCRQPRGEFEPRPLPEETPVRVATSECEGLRVELDLGRWAQTPSGVRSLSNVGDDPVLDSWEARGSLARLPADGGAGDRTGAGLELIPRVDDRPIGRKWPLQLLLDGEPVSAVEVRHDGRAIGVTDGEGRINVRFRSEGRHRFAVAHSVFSTEEAVERTLYHTILSLPAEEEE